MRNSAHQQCWAFVFLPIYSGQSIPVHFGSFTQPCHWLKRLHLVIRWGKICFFSHFAMQSNYLFQWMKPSLKVMIFPSADRQGMTSILWENTAKLFDATSIAGSLNAHLDSFCDGHLSRKAGSQERYQPPPKPPQETTMQKSRVSCKLQEEVDSVCQGTVQEKSG